MQRWICNRQMRYRKVELTHLYHGLKQLRFALLQREGDIAFFLAHLRDQRCNWLHRNRRETNPYACGRALSYGPHFLFESSSVTQEARGLRIKNSTGLSRDQTAPHPIEQRYAPRCLELPDRHAEIRLRNMKNFGRRGQRAVLDNRSKIGELS